jgi:hypothetical protein
VRSFEAILTIGDQGLALAMSRCVDGSGWPRLTTFLITQSASW